MTKEEVKKKLNSINVPGRIGTELYFLLHKGTAFEVVRADINDEAENDIQASALNVMNEIITDDEKTMMLLSLADVRSNALLEYDLEDVPEPLSLIKGEISPSTRFYSFESDKLNEIFGYLLRIGTADNYITLFRKQYPVSVISKDKVFSIKRLENESRFTKVKDDILKLSIGIDLINIDTCLIINNLSVLEKYFQFHQIIEKEAQKSIDVIDGTELLVDSEYLRKGLSKTSFARKIVKITSSSKVIGRIPISAIIKFTKDNPVLAGKFSYNDEGTKIKLLTKKSTDLFLKILNDDILISELTKTYYDSLAKDEIA